MDPNQKFINEISDQIAVDIAQIGSATAFNSNDQTDVTDAYMRALTDSDREQDPIKRIEAARAAAIEKIQQRKRTIDFKAFSLNAPSSWSGEEGQHLQNILFASIRAGYEENLRLTTAQDDKRAAARTQYYRPNYCCNHNLLWGALLLHSYNCHSSTHSSNDGAAIVALVVLAASAVVAGAYTVVNVIESVDEVAHGENVLINIGKLGTVSAVAVGGVFLGMAIGASVLGGPIVWGVLTAALLAGITYKCVNMIQANCVHDNRAELSASERTALERDGFDVDVVEMVLHDLQKDFEVIDKKHGKLSIGSEGADNRKEIMKLMRDLKKGKLPNVEGQAQNSIAVRGKIYQLKKDQTPSPRGSGEH